MIRNKIPDKNRALSLLRSAKSDLAFTLTIKLNDDSANTIARNIYESFRMLGEALLLSKGLQSQDHILPINELIKLKISTPRPMNILDNFRRLRHDINYYGYKATIVDAQDIINFAKSCFNIAYEEVKRIINEP